MKSHTFVDGICSVCGAEKAHEHEKTKLIAQSAATCTTDGFMRYKCSCGYVFEEVIPSRGGHDWYLYGTEEPSCIDGYELYFCEYCGASYQKDLPATGEHRWGVIQSHSATCTAPSYDECECMVCHEKMNSEDGPALGHDYKGDCARKECTRCGDVITGRHDFKITETHFIYSFSNTDYVWVDTVDYDCSICGRGVIFYGGCESEELANDGIANKGCWIYKGTLCKTEKEFALLIKEYG